MRNVVPPRKAIAASVLVKTVVVLLGCGAGEVSERPGGQAGDRKETKRWTHVAKDLDALDAPKDRAERKEDCRAWSACLRRAIVAEDRREVHSQATHHEISLKSHPHHLIFHTKVHHCFPCRSTSAANPPSSRLSFSRSTRGGTPLRCARAVQRYRFPPARYSARVGGTSG